MTIILLLAAQAAGQEITTFHPLPSQRQQEQAQQPSNPSGGSAPQEAKPAPKPAEAEEIKVLSVRVIPPNANVRFVPPPEEPPE